MRRLVLGCLMLLSSLTAFADHSDEGSEATDSSDVSFFDHSDENRSADACWQFDRMPRRCEANGCRFNHRTLRCVGAPVSRRPWVCNAVDNGWEEHRQAHQGRGWSKLEAARNALAICQRYHGRCQVSQCGQY